MTKEDEIVDILLKLKSEEDELNRLEELVYNSRSSVEYYTDLVVKLSCEDWGEYKDAKKVYNTIIATRENIYEDSDITNGDKS